LEKVTPQREVKILDYRKVPGMTSARLGKFDVIFTYMLDAEGPFTITVPYEDLAGKPDAAQEAVVTSRIMAEQKERVSWVGRSVKVG
jgi:hypothetical protein